MVYVVEKAPGQKFSTDPPSQGYCQLYWRMMTQFPLGGYIICQTCTVDEARRRVAWLRRRNHQAVLAHSKPRQPGSSITWRWRGKSPYERSTPHPVRGAARSAL